MGLAPHEPSSPRNALKCETIFLSGEPEACKPPYCPVARKGFEKPGNGFTFFQIMRVLARVFCTKTLASTSVLKPRACAAARTLGENYLFLKFFTSEPDTRDCVGTAGVPRGLWATREEMPRALRGSLEDLNDDPHR